MKPKSKHLTPEKIEYLKEHYPDTDNEILAREMGLSVYTIRSRARRHNLHKTAEYMRGLNSRKAIKYNNAARLNTPESVSKRNKTIQKKRKLEKARAAFGLPRETKWHFRIVSRGRTLQKNYLKSRGYIMDAKNGIAYYTPETNRSIHLEKIPKNTRKNKMRAWFEFKPIEEKENQ